MESKEKQIEDIAWQVFLNKSGISFRRELTAEEKKSVTDVETYQYYRDKATKLYDKKQRALSNKKYPIIDIPADGKSGMWGGAYCLCFVYSKYKGNFVLRGYMREVEAYLKKNYTHYFYNMSLWHLGMDRNIWSFWKDDIAIFTPSRESKTHKGKKKWKFQVRPYSSSYNFDDDAKWEEKEKIFDRDSLWFKRMPHQWIPEFDNLKNEN